MFTTESENRDYAVKPMNCPGHVQIFNTDLRSYRDLPLRYGEFGFLPSQRALGRAARRDARARLHQDDGHIFCTEDQIQSEVTAFNDLVRKVYADFGFTMSPSSWRCVRRRVGADDSGTRPRPRVRAALTASGLAWEELPGEGAFYGPKIEFHIKDAIGRSWQCGTVQVDFSMPGRLGAEYVGEDNSRHTPVMLHRAILGSLERFIGILVENHAGAFPLWLAPVQAVVMNISEAQADYAENVAKMLREAGLRVESDLRGEKINYKIREHSLLKRPYIVVVGDKEKAAGLVALRARGNQDLGQMSPQALIERLLHEKCTRRCGGLIF
jgi:threonyl-tRNA synthetase